jgi:hypothetical protein
MAIVNAEEVATVIVPPLNADDVVVVADADVDYDGGDGCCCCYCCCCWLSQRHVWKQPRPCFFVGGGGGGSGVWFPSTYCRLL